MSAPDKAVLAVAPKKTAAPVTERVLDLAFRAVTGNGGAAATAERAAGVLGKGAVLEVQYNPQTLSISAQGGRSGGDDGEDGRKHSPGMQASVPEYMTLSAELELAGEETMKMMNALFALAALDCERQVMFAWGQFCFQGRISSLSGSYTMFKPDGTPVRGKINLTLTACSAQAQEEYWDRAFEEMP